MMTLLTQKIETALNSIRPYLEMDGGNIELMEVDPENNVTLKFIGNCGTCPMSSITFKTGVIETLKKEVPEINTVEAVNIN